MVEIIALVASILMGLFGFVLTIVHYYKQKGDNSLDNKITSIEKRIDDLEDEIKQEIKEVKKTSESIKSNYLHRFDRLHEANANNTYNILKQFAELRELVIDKFQKKEDCFCDEKMKEIKTELKDILKGHYSNG